MRRPRGAPKRSPLRPVHREPADGVLRGRRRRLQPSRARRRDGARAMRSKSTEHRLLVVAPSEVNRGAYRNDEVIETSNDMAAGKESGAIEFSVRRRSGCSGPRRGTPTSSRCASRRTAGGPGRRFRVLAPPRPRPAPPERVPRPDAGPRARDQGGGRRAREESRAGRRRCGRLVTLLRGVTASASALRAAVKVAGHKWGVNRLGMHSPARPRAAGGPPREPWDRGARVSFHLEPVGGADE